MESLRFLMVTTFYPPYHIGGDAVHVRYLAKALAEQGHEVHVEFAPSAYRLKGGRGPLPALDEDGITVHPIPSRLGRLQPIGAYLSGGSRSVSRTHAELMSRLRPDVVHLHNISLLGFGVLRSRSATTLYTAHDYWVRCPRSDLFKYGRYPCDAPTCLRCTLVSGKPPQLWRYREGWRGLRGVDLVITPSRFMMQALEGYLNCPIVHIPNFAPDPNPGGRAWEPSDYYLYAGVYETHKGVLELAEAAGKNPTPWSVVLAGRGTLGNRLKRFEARADGRVKVHEWLAPDELARLYRSARAFVMPSLSWENSPLGAIEALSWGAPLLVSRRGGLEELLHEGAGGRSFNPGVAGLLSAFRQFEEDGLPSALRRSARLAYEVHHRPQSYLKRYMDACNGLARSRDRVAHPQAAAQGGNQAKPDGVERTIAHPSD